MLAIIRSILYNVINYISIKFFEEVFTRMKNILSLEELQEKRNNKGSYKTDILGLKKIGCNYLFQLQDSAEFYSTEAIKRKYDLIRIYKKLSVKLDKYLKTEEELKSLDSDNIMDYITDMMCDLCGYDN